MRFGYCLSNNISVIVSPINNKKITNVFYTFRLISNRHNPANTRSNMDSWCNCWERSKWAFKINYLKSKQLFKCIVTPNNKVKSHVMIQAILWESDLQRTDIQSDTERNTPWSTELSKYIWELNGKNIEYNIK